MKTEREGGWEGGGEAAVTKEGSIEASARPGGFCFTTAEAEVLLVLGDVRRTNSRGGCRDRGASDAGSWSSALSTIASTVCPPAGSFGPVSRGLRVLLRTFRGGEGAKKSATSRSVKELNDEGKHTPLDFGSGDGGGRGNQFEGRSHQVDVAVG